MKIPSMDVTKRRPSLLSTSLLLSMGLAAASNVSSQNAPLRQPTPADADQVALEIRRHEADPATSERSAALMAAASSAADLASALPAGSDLWRRLQSDRIYALSLAAADKQAVETYRLMQSHGVPVAAHAIPPLAGALGRIGLTDEALALLAPLARERPRDPDLPIRMAYVLSDAGRYPAAREPLVAWLATHGTDAAAEDVLSASLALARVDRWHDRPELAQRTLSGLEPRHADNARWRAEAAAVARALGKPRTAIALGQSLATVDAGVVSAQAWLDLGRPDLAAAGVAAAGDADLARRLELARGARGVAGASWGNTRSAALASPNGSNESSVTFRWDSPLLGSGWRIGAAVENHRAQFRGSEPESRHGGIRLVRHLTGGEATLELGRSFDDFLPGPYAIATLDAWLTDHWRLAARLASNDPEASLQARASGIGNDGLQVSTTWRPSLAWRLDAGAGVSEFDDGNRRRWGSLSAEHLLASAPGARTSVFAGLYASRNSLDEAAYFNPRRDASLEAGLVHGFNGWGGTWQTLRPSVSLYQQDGFGSAAIPRLRYAVRWPIASGRWLEASAAGARPVYDGRRETHWSLAMTYAWGQP